LARSSSGIRSSSASSSTRALKSSQDSSRFVYRLVESRSGAASSTSWSASVVIVSVAGSIAHPILPLFLWGHYASAVIWLLRHGDAEDGSPDAERRLTEKGEEQARIAGKALKRLGVELDACVTSPKVRARDTARLACEPLGVEASEDDRLEGGPFDVAEVTEGLGEEVLLVGHDPDFSMAVHTETGAQVRMPKGAIAGIDRGELKVMLRPEDLRALAD
jgi:phosphohistidine phosphatase